VEVSINSIDAEVAAVAAGQHGIITRAEAIRLGLSQHQINHRLETGRWQTLRRGIYLVSGVPPTWEQHLFAAVLACGAPAVVSHASAARHWGLMVPSGEDGGFEVSVPWPMYPRVHGVRTHRRKFLDPLDMTSLRGIPITTVALTLVDLSYRFTERGLQLTVDDALRRHLLRLPHLRACVQRLHGYRQRGLGAIDALLERRGPGFHPGDSDSELRVGELLVAAGLPAPVKQHKVVIDGEHYKLDLSYPPLKIDIEYLGFEVHTTEAAFHRDRRRATELRLAGWLVLELTWETSDAQIVSQVRRAIELRVGGRSTPLLPG
jgi:hypothetical protein